MPDISSDRERVRECPLTDSGVFRVHERLRMQKLPTRDETAGLTIGGALGVILVWVLEVKGHTVPVPVAAAIGTVMAQVTHYAFSFLPRRV